MNLNQHNAAAASEYHEFPPSPNLAEYVVCLWTQTIHSQTEFLQRVLPDCCIDLLLINGIPMVVGPWTEPFVANLAAGTNILGARFHPGVASSLLGVPAFELLNRSVALGDVWGDAGVSALACMADETTLKTQISAMEAVLLTRAASASPADNAIRAGIQWMARHPHGRVEQLSHWLGLSSRQIQRRFTMAVGYGPKLFQSVLRFQRLLHLAGGTGVRRNLAQIAADADYADQAHMTREVRRFSGNPPSVVLQSLRCTLGLSGLV